jgi:RNA polymerase sigma factor (sigma-70 family)
METVQASSFSKYLRKIVLPQDDGGMTNGQLLECFLAQRDEAAFAALMRRHGPMVFGVCRRVLRNAHDAEDAFQATFLVLVRKARSIGRPELLGNWLYGVAYRTALAARGATAKRRAKEREMAKSEAVEETDWHEPASLLDSELVRLPEKYRVPIVLCDLAGKTRKEAARQLGWPEGTINSRLARGRVILAKRLSRLGAVFSGGAIAAAMAEQAASVGMPVGLQASTLKAATVVAAGTATATGIVSAKVVALTDRIVKTMFLTKLQIAATLLTAVVAVGATMAFGPLSPQADKPAQNRPEFATGNGPELPAKDKESKADDPTQSKASTPNQSPKDKEPQADDLKANEADVSKQNLLLKQHLEEYKAALKCVQADARRLKKVIKQEREQIVGKLTKIDVEKNTVSINLRGTAIAINDLPLSTALKVIVKTKGETIDDLKVGMQVKMQIETTDGKSFVGVVRELDTEVDILAEITENVSGWTFTKK